MRLRNRFPLKVCGNDDEKKKNMPKQITRREILKFAGGSALGLLFTPLPWKLLDDSAIWTQNWSLTPKLPRGPITTKFSVCTLCGGGCAVKAKCVSETPYYLTGISNHPLTHGTLCPRGITGHHLAYHPLRIRFPHKFAGKSDESKLKAISSEEAMNEIAAAVKQAKGSVAILDQQPGRAISEVYQQLLAKLPNGVYLSDPSQEEATLIALRRMMNGKSEPLGFDFENTKLVVSFGAPLLDGWGTPGRMTEIFHTRKENGLRLIQIESRQSSTARQADEWIPINPDSEKYFAFAIANVLISESLYSKSSVQHVTDFISFKTNVKEFTPEKTAAIIGIEAGVIRAIARKLAAAESAIVLSSADAGAGPLDDETEKAIAILNVLTGNVGKQGGIVARREIPGYREIRSEQWCRIPDNSISVLIIDSADSGYALPWELVERKLAKDNTVVTLSPYLSELSAHADYIIPAPAHFESLQDATTSSGNTVAAFSLSSPLLKKQEGTTEPIEFVKSLSGKINLSLEIPTHEELLKQKAEAIHSSKRGIVHSFADGARTEIKDISSPGDLWMKFTEGAVWIDDTVKQNAMKQFTFSLNAKMEITSKVNSILLVPYGWRGTVSAALMSPVMSKVFQEMELRDVNGVVSVNPATARELGLSTEKSATLKTEKGSMTVQVKINNAVRPGIIEASVGPLPNGVQTPVHFNGENILNLCSVTENGTWRVTKATLMNT